MSKGVSTVIATLLMLIITIALAGLAYSYISGVFSAKTGKIVEVDTGATFCSSNITVYIKGTGTVDFSSSTVNIQKQGVGSAVVCAAGTNDVVAGGAAIACTNTITGTQGNNIIVVSGANSAGPTNTVRANVFCP